ncbi:MAG: hypothetical protein U5Q44_06375 [Dehalococcoidia bacterium]|nr:hypothetical protein [Dehalococcoidia bacterium]
MTSKTANASASATPRTTSSDDAAYDYQQLAVEDRSARHPVGRARAWRSRTPSTSRARSLDSATTQPRPRLHGRTAQRRPRRSRHEAARRSSLGVPTRRRQRGRSPAAARTTRARTGTCPRRRLLGRLPATQNAVAPRRGDRPDRFVGRRDHLRLAASTATSQRRRAGHSKAARHHGRWRPRPHQHPGSAATSPSPRTPSSTGDAPRAYPGPDAAGTLLAYSEDLNLSALDSGTNIEAGDEKLFCVYNKSEQTTVTGSLEVTKTVNWNGVTPDEGQTFEIRIEGRSHPNGDEDGACKTADHDGEVLSGTDLETGDDTVSETDPGNEWTVNVTGSPAAAVDGIKAEAFVTNTYDR